MHQHEHQRYTQSGNGLASQLETVLQGRQDPDFGRARPSSPRSILDQASEQHAAPRRPSVSSSSHAPNEADQSFAGRLSKGHQIILFILQALH